jgi:hypothetical protein
MRDLVALKRNNSPEWIKAVQCRSPSASQKKSAREKGVDADWDVILLLLHLNRADLGRHHVWLPLHLLLLRPTDEKRCAASHAGARESTVTGGEEEWQQRGGAAEGRERRYGFRREREREREREAAMKSGSED